jgi:hypothetical protein
MIQNNFPPKLDQDAERKRALAKVYSILLRIAEEHEATKAIQNEEKTSELLQENIPPAV